MTARALSRSLIVQRVSAVSSPADSFNSAFWPQLQSVQAAGMSVRLPSGKITSKSRTPRRFRLLMTESRHPSKGWRLRMTTVET